MSLMPVLAQEAPPTPPVDPNKTYSPVAKYSLGDLLKYNMNMKMNMGMTAEKADTPLPKKMEMEVSAVAKMKTVKVGADGSAVVMILTESSTVTVNGSKAAAPAAPPMKMEINKLGVAKMSGLEKVQGAEMFSKMFNLDSLPSMGAVFPDHPVKVSESWETFMPNPFGGEEKLKIVSTLLGTEKIGGRETLKIKMVINMPMKIAMGANSQPTKDVSTAIMVMTGSINGNSIMNVIEETGRLVKSISSMKGDMNMEMKGDAAKQSPFGTNINMKLDGVTTLALFSEGKVPATPAKAVIKPAIQPAKTKKK